MKRQFNKLFNENHTVKGIKVEIQLKEDAKLIQQKGRPIPFYLLQSVEKEIEKLKSQGHLKKRMTLTKIASSAHQSIPSKKINW